MHHFTYSVRGHHIPAVAHAAIMASLKLQGIGRLTLSEVRGRAANDLDILEALLSGNDWLTGDTPTAADCFLFGLLDCVRAQICCKLMWCISFHSTKMITYDTDITVICTVMSLRSQLKNSLHRLCFAGSWWSCGIHSTSTGLDRDCSEAKSLRVL
jgi:Glutathione S-transferase, C-terminal domain